MRKNFYLLILQENFNRINGSSTNSEAGSKDDIIIYMEKLE